jgi:hypothetical protein
MVGNNQSMGVIAGGQQGIGCQWRLSLKRGHECAQGSSERFKLRQNLLLKLLLYGNSDSANADVIRAS